VRVSWQRVFGHDALVEDFDRVVCAGRLAHAYFFAGPAGVGKRLFAGELAKALLCEAPGRQRLEACDRCPACLQFAAGAHPDFIAVGRPDDKLELPIDVVRELCRNLSLKPARGGYKVAVLDDADDLNEESANCFLKTLEEPPPRSVLILVGTRPERQLATIVSRCQVVRFAPLAEALVIEVLRGQGQEDPDQLGRLARLSNGSPGEALALADPELWEFRKKLLEGLTRPRIDSVALARAWWEFVEEAGKEGPVQRRRAALVLRLLIEFFNDALRCAIGAPPRSADPGDLRYLRELGERVDSEQMLRLLERCLEADQHMDRRVQLVLILEALVDAVGQGVQRSAG
jgi:DNA polymerase-3 subunit delta'